MYVGAVINYAAQSEMTIYLLRAIRRMVVQKYYEDIDAGVKVHSIINFGWVYFKGINFRGNTF